MDIPSEATDTEKRMCLNKIPFVTMMLAYKFIAKRKFGGKPMSDDARPYKCPFCKNFHISSKPIIKQESSPEYLEKLLKNQGFDGDFAARFINHTTKSK